MATFYTKDQIDSLGNIIGQRIRDSVNTSSVTEALVASENYHLLSNAEKEAVDALILAGPNVGIEPPPSAENITDYLTALDSAILGSSEL